MRGWSGKQATTCQALGASVFSCLSVTSSKAKCRPGLQLHTGATAAVLLPPPDGTRWAKNRSRKTSLRLLSSGGPPGNGLTLAGF